MENGEKNAIQLDRMIFNVTRKLISNLNFDVFYLFIENSHFRHSFENLRKSKQASIGNRFSCKYPQGQLFTKARLGLFIS